MSLNLSFSVLNEKEEKEKKKNGANGLNLSFSVLGEEKNTQKPISIPSGNQGKKQSGNPTNGALAPSVLSQNDADAQANSITQPTRAEYNAMKQDKWREKYSGYSFKDLEKAMYDLSNPEEKQWIEDFIMSDESGSNGAQRLWHNIKKGLTGALKSGAEGTLASNVNTMATNYEMGQKTRSEMNSLYLNDAKDTLAQAEKEYELMLQDNKTKPGTYSDRELQTQQNIINDAKTKIAAFETADTAQKKATQATYKIADTVQEKANKTLEDSTRNMGEVGKILTQGASSSVQSGLDLATNMILGMKPNYVPFAMRAFGSSTQQARQQGASLEQQIAYGAASTAKEILTEMIFDVNVLQQKAYGKNTKLSADDLVRKAIDKAVKNIDNKALKAITNGTLHLGSSMVSEGLEELIGDFIEWQLPRIYGGETDTFSETLTKSLNDFLVGAAAGLTGDVSGTIINAPTNAIRESSLGSKVKKTGMTEALIETGLANKPDMKSYQRAAEIQNKQEQGKKLRSREIGRLYIDTLNDIEGAKKENSDLPTEPKRIRLKTADEAMGGNINGNTGELLHDGSLGRNAGESAGEQARRMAEGSGSIESGQEYRADTGARAVEARGITENLRIQPVSAKSLGFSNGTDAATMSFIPAENETSWMQETRQRVKDNIGTEVRYYTGQMQIAANNERGYVTPNAAIKNGVMYLQADNAKWSVEQLAAHESFHELVRQNREFYTSTQNKILSKYNAQSFMGVMNSYMKNLSSMNYTADQIVEEIFADAYAGMNAFDAGATQYSDTVRETVNEVRKPTQTAAATEETTGPPSREVVKQRVEQLRQDLSEGKITEAEFDEQYDLLSQEENWQDKENFSVSRIEDPEQKKKVVNQLRKYMNGSMSLDELRGYINGAADNTNTQTANTRSSEADEIIRAAKERGMSAREYVNENWDYYEQNGKPNAAAQEAISRERGSFSVTEDENPLDTAISMLDSGATPTEVFNETGLVVKNNGDIQDGFSGKTIGRYNYGKTDEGTIRGSSEGNRSGEVYGQSDRGTLEEYTSEKSTTSGRLKEWDNVAESDRQEIVKIVSEHMEASDDEASLDFIDAYGGIDNFTKHVYNSLTADYRTGEYYRIIIPDFEGLVNEIEDIAGNERQSFSISTTTANEPFVEVKEDILAGVPEEEWVSAVKENLKQKFPDGITIGNNEINIDYQSRNEMTFSKYMRWLFNNDQQLRADKLRATNNSDEILKATTDWINEGLHHPRNDSIADFARGKVLLRVGGNDYIADVVVGTRKNGSMMLYDILNLQPTSFIEKETAAAVAENPSPGTNRSTAAVSGDNIADTGEDVKRLSLPRADENLSVTDEEEIMPKSITLPRADDTSSVTEEVMPKSITLPKAGEVTRDTLNTKARNALKGAERRLSTKTANALSIPTRGVRDVLTPEIQKLSDEYLRTGRISDDRINDAFETAYEQGIIVDDQFLKDYKGVKDYLRTQGITINEYDTHDIPDYGAFRKSLFGTMKIVKDGLPIDTAYQELRGMAPELFPDSITAPSDMLLHMADVARQIRASEKSLDEYYGSEAKIFKEYSRHDFIDAVNSMIPDLRSIRTYAEAKAAPQEEPITTLEQAKEAWTKLKDARRTYEKAAAKNLLSERDEMQVGRLLRGEILLEDLDGSRDNIRGITAVYEAKQEYEKLSQTLRTYKAQRRKALDTVADEFLQNASFWKDKKAGIEYARETQERNIEDIVRDAKGNLDSKTAQAIKDFYFTPVQKSQAESNRYQNAMRDRVKKLDLSRKVEKGNLVSEAHATQLLGEALDNIQMLEKSKGRITERDGKSLSDWRGVVQELYKSNPNMDFNKISKAIEEFRKIYDELFERMNEVRVRNGYEPINYRHGYFPHFQPGQDGIFGVFSNVLGISADVTALPTSINGLTHTFKPGITWFGNAQERLGFNTAYDAVEGFDKYISGAADVIFQTDNIQRLRSFARRIRYNTTDEGIRQKVDRILQDPTLSEANKQELIDGEYSKTNKFTLSHYIVDLEEYTNLLANKKSRADRNWEEALGRKWYNIAKRFESLVASNMVGMNVGSWLTNFIPLTQGGAMIGRGQMLQAMRDTLKSYVNNDGFVDRSTFLTNRRGTDAIVRSWDQKISTAIGSPMEFIDRFTADTLVRARYAQNVKQGMSEQAAMDEADAFAASVMADRSKGSTPTLFSRHNPWSKLYTQFQLEVNNQLSFLFKDMPRLTRDKSKKALIAALLKFFIGAFIYNEAYEFLVGRRAALDPVGILNETSGDVFGYELPNLIELGVGAIKGDAPSLKTEKTSLYEAGVNLGENVLEEMPFTAALALTGWDIDAGRLPVSSAIPDLSAIKTYLDPEVSKEKKLSKAKGELIKGLYLLPTGGGGQIKKAIQGIGAVVKGGSFTVDNNGNDILQYPAYTDTAAEKGFRLATAATFGKSSLPRYDDWVDSNFKNLSANETITYEEMVEAGTDGNKLFDFLRKIKKFSMQAEKANAIIESDFSKDEKIALTDFLIGKRVTDNGKLTDRFETETDGGNDNQYAKFHKALDAGVSVDDCLKALVNGTKLDKLTEAKDAGLDLQKYDELQEKEISLEKYDEIRKAGLSVDEYVGLRDKDISIKQYEDKIADGYSKQGAVKIIEAMDGVGSKNAERYAAIKNAGLSTSDFETAVRDQLGDDEYKIDVADDYGINTSEYVDFQIMLPKYDEDNNGSYKQKEIENALRAASGMTNEERAALWQIQSGSKTAKNNPFDRSVGQAVVNAITAKKK